MATKKTSVGSTGGKPADLTVPPTVASSAPDTPANYEKLNADQVRVLRKSTLVQGANMGVMAAELAASTTYEDDFGKKAPKIAPNLKIAAAWTTESERARQWADYCDDMSLLAKNQVLSDQKTFKQDYSTALHHDSSIALRYPATHTFMTARSSMAQRGAATRKKNLALATTDDEGETDTGHAPATSTAASNGASVSTSAAAK